MRGEILFEKLADIADGYIEEAAIDITANGVLRRGRRVSPFVRFAASGWGVACLCAVVSLVVVAALIRFSPAMDAVKNDAEHSPGQFHGQFMFSYSFYNNANESETSRTAEVGESFTVETGVTNLGAAFSYVGSSSDFSAHAVFVHQDDESVTLTGFMACTDDYGTFRVTTGETGRSGWFFSVPMTARGGVYDLVLSYGGVTVVFDGVLTVTAVEEAPAPETVFAPDDFALEFGYQPSSIDGFIVAPRELTITVWVKNTGAAYIHHGYFAPDAKLRHAESGYTVDSMFGEIPDIEEMTIQTGEVGSATPCFSFPADAPAGAYDLVLSIRMNGNKVEQVFEGVLTVGLENAEASGPFLFGYERTIVGDVQPSDSIEIWVMVRNEGEDFTYVGDPFDFAPKAVLYHMDDPTYTVKGFPPPTGMEPQECTVKHGQIGDTTNVFTFPADAPAGEYGLILSYGESSQRYASVVTVVGRDGEN